MIHVADKLICTKNWLAIGLKQPVKNTGIALLYRLAMSETNVGFMAVECGFTVTHHIIRLQNVAGEV